LSLYASKGSRDTSPGSHDGPRVVWSPRMGLALIPTTKYTQEPDIGVGLTPSKYGEAEEMETRMWAKVALLVEDADADLLE
jgi:hypothetical protein